jgi:hypothetical protein
VAKSRRRRGPGSLSQLKGYLWVAINYELSVIEDEEQSRSNRHAAVNGLTQAALAYTKITETESLSQRIEALEAAMQAGKDRP